MIRRNSAIEEALARPNGARFFRCALQVNPVTYQADFRGQASRLSEDDHALAVVEECQDLEIDVIAVTDHNSVAGITAFRRAASGTGLTVFPGFEVRSSEGIHVLCLYEVDTPQDKLERFLGALGIHDTQPTATLSSLGFSKVLEEVESQGGLVVAAHITQSGGLLTELKGEPRAQAWKDERLLAVQIPGPIDDLPIDLRRIVRDQDPAYRLTRPVAEGGLSRAVVNAADIAAPDDLAKPGAWCWIKMSRPSLEGLRQAFLDPLSRIRLPAEVVSEPHLELAAMSWEGGFLDGLRVHFNENLNVLIGGRGTGKSTIVESLRAVLGMEALTPEAQRAHQGIVKAVLRNGTKISLLARVHTPSRCEYLIERTIPEPPTVRDDLGTILEVTPLDVLSGVEVYGQHEISELTKDENNDKLTRLLARFMKADPLLAQRNRELRRDLERSRLRLLQAEKELKDTMERLSRLPALEETLRKYQRAGVEEKLREQSLIVREERVLTVSRQRLAPFQEVRALLAESLPIDRAFLAAKALEDLPGAEILRGADPVLEALEAGMGRALASIDAGLEAAGQGLAVVEATWQRRKQAVTEASQAILRELQKDKIDGGDFMRHRRDIEALRPLQDRLKDLEKAVDTLRIARNRLVAEWADSKGAEYRELSQAARKVTKRLTGRARVTVQDGGNRSPLHELLRERVGGNLKAALETLDANPSLSLRELVAACRTGKDALVKELRLPLSAAERLALAGEDVFMQIEELELPPTTKIELNTGSEHQPVWQALDELSTGQKATAVLLLLLLESEAPLVVDQPEDDLDNRFITEGIVPRMREEKQRRQFVFATHNANIPVLGDAELILGLTAGAEQASVDLDHAGALDDGPVRDMVEEILEGGREAFERRRQKYHF